MKTLIKNGTIVSDGTMFHGSVLIEDSFISDVFRGDYLSEDFDSNVEIVDAEGLYVLPGVIDEHVHFREPGDCKAGSIESESKAALLGGVTSFMDMPNNNPPATSVERLEKKIEIAEKCSYANYSFYLGASNDNLSELQSIDPHKVCGLKIFMGASTGNLLVDNTHVLERMFEKSPVPIAVHCEDNGIIQSNLQHYRELNALNIGNHNLIRSREACIKSSRYAVSLAQKYGSRLHILHISTAEEVAMLRKLADNADCGKNRITGEACVHYLWFCDKDCSMLGNLVKCNPAIKQETDMQAIRDGVADGTIMTVATDHAPHLLEEKMKPYADAPGGVPLVQYSLQMMTDLCRRGIFTLPQMVARMSHGPAECYGISRRGFIKKGYYADIVLVNLLEKDTYSPFHPASKCGWSPFEYCGDKNFSFSSSIEKVFVNGVCAVDGGKLTGSKNSKSLEYER